MRILFVLPSLLLIQLSLIAQEPGGSLITETGILKVPFRIPNNPSTVGSPMLYTDFVNGTLIYENGNRSDVSKLNYDASSGSLVFLYNQEMWKVNTSVREFILKSNIDNGVMRERLFRSGYPPINTNDATTYYEILVNGNLQLLAHLKREIKLNTGYGVASYNEFVTVESHYFFDGNSIKPLPTTKAEFLGNLPASQRSKAEALLEGQKFNFKKLSSVKELLEMLNK